jgi:hypothetical protein
MEVSESDALRKVIRSSECERNSNNSMNIKVGNG